MPRGTRLSVGDTSFPENRILRITCLHYKATNEDIQEFFSGYDMVEWKRDSKASTRQQSIAYVLMGSMSDLIRAENDLDYGVILGRPVRVMRARRGFQLTEEGLLNPRKAESAATKARQQVQNITTNHALIVEDDVIETAVSYTPHLRKPSWATDPQQRVLLINNLHPDADENAVRLFFTDYDVTDFKRNMNMRTNRPMPVAFVMMGSIEERNRAKDEKNGQKLMGRTVTIEWVTQGVKVNETGFKTPESDKTITPSTFTLPGVSEKLRSLSFRAPPVESSEVPQTSHYLQMKEPDADIPLALSSLGYEEPANVDVVGQEDKVAEASPILSFAGHTVNGALESTAPFYQQDFTCQDRAKPRLAWDSNAAHIPLGTWNLAGKDSTDRQFNVMTEEDWYYFQSRELAKFQ